MFRQPKVFLQSHGEKMDEQVSRTPGALLLHSKGTFDAVKGCASAALSITDNRSVVEGLAFGTYTDAADVVTL